MWLCLWIFSSGDCSSTCDKQLVVQVPVFWRDWYHMRKISNSLSCYNSLLDLYLMNFGSSLIGNSFLSWQTLNRLQQYMQRALLLVLRHRVTPNTPYIWCGSLVSFFHVYSSSCTLASHFIRYICAIYCSPIQQLCRKFYIYEAYTYICCWFVVFVDILL